MGSFFEDRGLKENMHWINMLCDCVDEANRSIGFDQWQWLLASWSKWTLSQMPMGRRPEKECEVKSPAPSARMSCVTGFTEWGILLERSPRQLWEITWAGFNLTHCKFHKIPFAVEKPVIIFWARFACHAARRHFPLLPHGHWKFAYNGVFNKRAECDNYPWTSHAVRVGRESCR